MPPAYLQIRIAALRRNARACRIEYFAGVTLNELSECQSDRLAKMAAIVVGEGLIVLIEIDTSANGVAVDIRLRARRLGDGLFQLETAAESELLIVGEALVVKHQHRVLIHSGVNCTDLTGGKRLRKIDAGNLSAKRVRPRISIIFPFPPGHFPQVACMGALQPFLQCWRRIAPACVRSSGRQRNRPSPTSS